MVSQREHAGASDDSATPRWELYRLLSDPVRLRILALTSLHELAVSELAELLRVSQPKVSRQAASLRDARILHGRKQGTWVLLRCAREGLGDAVVADALAAGLELCERDGSALRVERVVGERDQHTREFFARSGRPARVGPPEELAAYLRALAPLLPRRGLAIDAGTGDGALLEVLAPVFKQVIALDRSEAQLALAQARAKERGFDNVAFVNGELDGEAISAAIANHGAADAVFAARILHHAPVPERTMRSLAQLSRPPGKGESGGLVVVLDYEAHRDESMRDEQADLWLGFDPSDLQTMAEEAGLGALEHHFIPNLWCGDGPDRHLRWQLLSGRRISRS